MVNIMQNTDSAQQLGPRKYITYALGTRPDVFWSLSQGLEQGQSIFSVLLGVVIKHKLWEVTPFSLLFSSIPFQKETEK